MPVFGKTLGEYSGSRDADGLPHGKGTLKGPDGVYDGDFVHGVREGNGEMKFTDGSTCRGAFKAGLPHGWCEYFDPGDETTTRGNYVAGELHGAAEQRDKAGRLVFRGHFKHDVCTGVAEEIDEHGGRVIGPVDEAGELTGDELVYVFVSGNYGMLSEPLAAVNSPDNRDGMPDCEVALPTFIPSDVVPTIVYRDVSTRETLCRQPLVPDLYETQRVEVRCSTIDPSMQGLFARSRIPAGELCSWYNGVRCTHEEVDDRDWALNQATITLDAETVLDVPEEYNSTDKFCACLGHKANHSVPNNAKYDVFDHPRFGQIKAIRSVRDIDPGEEVCCDYGYKGDPEDLPRWYVELHSKLLAAA